MPRPGPLKLSQKEEVRGAQILSGSRNKENYDMYLSDLLQNQEITSIGGYVLGETIGKGTYGEVKIATHQLTKQKVAVKIMNKSYGPLALREVQTWRYMRHPNIVQLYEVLASESYIYLIMELASCGEVFDYIVSRGKMKEKEAKKIFYQLANAVDYCHKKGFVHRDLKPENLLLDSSWNLKLVDFGFTRKYDPNRLLDTYCGSVSYVAPEIIKKEKYSGPESDIWSIGVILFTLLCGRLPFDDEHGNDSEVFEKILNLNYKIDNSCSPEAKNLIEGILKLNPKDRLTINDILNHEWLSEFQNENTSKSKNLPSPNSSSTVNSLSSTSSNTTTQSSKANKTSGLVSFYNNIINFSNQFSSNNNQSPPTSPSNSTTTLSSQGSSSSGNHPFYNNPNTSSGSVSSNHNRHSSTESSMSISGLEEYFTWNDNDSELLETMKKLGFDQAQLCDSIQNYQPDQLSAIFFLLKKAKDSPPDLTTPIFYPISPTPGSSSNNFGDSAIDRYLKKADAAGQKSRRNVNSRRGLNQIQEDSMTSQKILDEKPRFNNSSKPLPLKAGASMEAPSGSGINITKFKTLSGESQSHRYSNSYNALSRLSEAPFSSSTPNIYSEVSSLSTSPPQKQSSFSMMNSKPSSFQKIPLDSNSSKEEYKKHKKTSSLDAKYSLKILELGMNGEEEKEEEEQDEVTSRRKASDLGSAKEMPKLEKKKFEKTEPKANINTERKLPAGYPSGRERSRSQTDIILEEGEEEENEDLNTIQDTRKSLEKELLKQQLKCKEKEGEKEKEKEKEVETTKLSEKSCGKEKDKDKDKDKTKEKEKEKKKKKNPFEKREEKVEVKKEGKIRQVREGLFDHKTTSTMEPIYILTEVIRVLNQKGMTFERDNYKLAVDADVNEKKNEIEITKGLDHSSIPTPLIQSPPRAVEYESSFDSDYQSLQQHPNTISGDTQNSQSQSSCFPSNSDSNLLGSQELPPTNYSSPMSTCRSISGENLSNPSLISRNVKFELEICRLGEKLHGIRLKRLNGDIWTYKTICDSIISELKI